MGGSNTTHEGDARDDARECQGGSRHKGLAAGYAEEMFGEMHSSTKTERHAYEKMLLSLSTPTGINIFDADGDGGVS